MLIGDQVLCRSPQFSNPIDIEDLTWYFLLESFDSESGVWLISPWISAFNFKRKLIYLPYVDSSYLTEILEKLSKHVTVHVLTRCFDDFLPLEVLYVLYKLYSENKELPDEVANLFLKTITESARRLRSLVEIASRGVLLRTDFTPAVGRVSPRLHAKLYVNDKLAMIGSSNLTYMGISREGNWECIAMFTNNNPLYGKLKSYAEWLFSQGHSFDDCVNSVINEVNNTLRPFYVSLNSLEDLERLLDELQKYLKSFIK